MKYSVKINWNKNSDETFIDNKYSRVHTWKFDGGFELKASASPQVVPLPLSDENAVDPEEAFIASLSSCHMLWFLYLAASKKFIVESYEDNPEGIVAKNEEGKLAFTEVTLKPNINFTGEKIPSQKEINELHLLSHEKCFIANSVKAKINY